MRPNVLLVVMDTARADAFGPYGAPAAATPAVSGLASRGSAVPVVHATANWTLPSHASLFSGRLPRPLGIGSGAPLHEVLAANEHRLLAPVLHDEGWHTVAVSANPFVSPAHGFGLGFDRFFDVTSARRPPAPGLGGRVEQAARGLLADVDDGLRRVETTVAAAIAEAPADRPWFVFVNLMECHAPYLPPRPWNDLGPVDRLRAASDVRRHQSHAAVVDACLGRHTVPPGDLARMRHLYDRSVSMMDAWLGRTSDHLASTHRLDDTLLIATSDHGENFGECGRLGHTLSIDERLLRVPLVAAGPGLDDVDTGGIISIADIPRLVATAAGLGRHPWGTPPCPDGVAVAQNDGYSAIDPSFARIFATEWHLDADAIERLDRPTLAAVGDRFKLVREEPASGPCDRLHDLATDPLETLDVASDHPDEVARLRAVLDAVSQPAMPPRSASGHPGRGADVDAGLVERLQVLGYL